MDEQTSMPTVEDIRAAFGLADEPEGSEESSTEATPTEVQSETSAEIETDETPTEGADETGTAEEGLGQGDQNTQEQAAQRLTEQQQQESTKANQAFARMRVENTQMQKTLGMMAQVLNVDPNQPIDQLSSALQNQAMAAIAKANNMDPAILQRLNQLEAINAEYTKVRMESEITSSLRTISEKYGATENDLQTFVGTLVQEGYDISAQGSDLETEFVKRHFSKILKNEVDKAIQAEQNRATKGGGASKPSAKQGKEQDIDDKTINTVTELEEFFSNLK